MEVYIGNQPSDKMWNIYKSSTVITDTFGNICLSCDTSSLWPVTILLSPNV